MKKFVFGILLIIGLIFVGTPVSAATTNEVETIDGLHNELVDLNIVSLDKDKKLIIDQKINQLEVNHSLLAKYKEKIAAVNFAVEKGLMWYDSDLQIQSLSPDEVTNKVYKEDQLKQEQASPGFSTYATALNVKNLVGSNYDEIVRVKRAGGTAFAIGYWVAKVKEGGVWDYKVQPGFSPWYKNFSMYLPNRNTETHNSKWLGNYNYGYTGSVLFNRSTLLLGGDAISYLINWRPDSYAAKSAVEKAYSHAKTYE